MACSCNLALYVFISPSCTDSADTPDQAVRGRVQGHTPAKRGMELVVFWCGRWVRTPGRMHIISVAEVNALFWHELSVLNLKKEAISSLAVWPLVQRTQHTATYRELASCPGDCARQVTFQHVSGLDGTTHAARAPVSPRWIPSPSRLFSPFSSFDGTGPRMRSRSGHMARPLRHPLIACRLQPDSRVPASGSYGTMPRWTRLRSGMRGRLRTAPCEATSADAGARR